MESSPCGEQQVEIVWLRRQAIMIGISCPLWQAGALAL